MADLGKVVYLSEAQKETLFTQGSITVGGTTITYSDNDLYVTPSAIDTAPTASSDNLVTSGGVYTALWEKAPLTSPALTGTPTAPTPTGTSGDTQIATKAYVDAASISITYNTTTSTLEIS